MKLHEYLTHSGLSQADVGKELGVTQSAVSQWIQRGLVPAEHCPPIEKLTKGLCRCEDLNDKVDWGFLRQTSERRKNQRSKRPGGRRETDPVVDRSDSK